MGEADAKLKALRTSASQVWDMVLSGIDGPSSVAIAVSAAAELLKGQIDNAAASGVCWGLILCWLPLCCISLS
jgi:hypothetical protein